VWRALEQEAPEDARWPFQIARNLLAQGDPRQARIHLQRFIYIRDSGAVAWLDAARLLLATGHPRRAGRFAVQALIFAETLAQRLDVIRILRRAGLKEQAREAVAVVSRRYPPEGAAARKIERVMQEPLGPSRAR
jgi:hypothetical protein